MHIHRTLILTQSAGLQIPRHPDKQMQTGETTHSVQPLLLYTEEALMITLSYRKYQMYTLSLAESLTYSHIHSHCHTSNFFSLLGDSPQS